jgi:outer membrane protein assembly factor BamB
MIYVMDDEGNLTVAKATPDSYAPLSSAKVLEGHDSWGPMVFVSGRLIVRDLTTMKCLDIMEN